MQNHQLVNERIQSVLEPCSLMDILKLPEQVPHLGYDELSFMGSGVVGYGGNSKGVWDYLIGPAYTTPSFIQKERVKVVLNGKVYVLDSPMHRSKGTGVFYSINRIEDVIIYLIDFAIMGKPFAARMIAAQNMSEVPITIAPYIELKHHGHYQKVGFIVNEGAKCEIVDESLCHMIQQEKWHMTVKFNEANSQAYLVDKEDFETFFKVQERTLKKDEYSHFTLYHYAHTDAESPNEIAKKIHLRDSLADLHHCLDEWKQWMGKGKSLEGIQDMRARYIVESTKILIRMQQGVDGGIIATPRTYLLSYVRDNHSALRGMMAAGHVEEARKFILWLHRLYKELRSQGGFAIPTAGGVGREDTFLGFGDENNWSCESPGLYVLIIRKYYELTQDLELVKTVRESLEYAMKVQLDFAKANNWCLIFNGDETESNGCGINLKESGRPEGNPKWSMPSLVMCMNALEFYMEYLRLTEETERLDEYSGYLEAMKVSLDKTFWREELQIYDWYRGLGGEWPKTRVSNYHIMPLYFGGESINKERASKTALAMKQYITDRGFIPNQPLGENDDFCGHNMGYLLYALTEFNDPLKDAVYDKLINGGTVGCWGMYAESYYDDGTPYGAMQTMDNHIHGLRPFESGTNIEAILKYWGV